jgi:uncharacterized protein YaaR (DUF327 family)
MASSSEKSKAFVYQLLVLAETYIDECLSHTTQEVSQGRVVEKLNRHIPTIDFFLRIWIPRNYSRKDTIKRSSYYRWLNWTNTEKQRVIYNIDEAFKALARDIVANEGKGIFYAKNRLGMHDRQQLETKTVEKFEFE